MTRVTYVVMHTPLKDNPELWVRVDHILGAERTPTNQTIIRIQDAPDRTVIEQPSQIIRAALKAPESEVGFIYADSILDRAPTGVDLPEWPWKRSRQGNWYWRVKGDTYALYIKDSPEALGEVWGVGVNGEWEDKGYETWQQAYQEIRARVYGPPVPVEEKPNDQA